MSGPIPVAQPQAIDGVRYAFFTRNGGVSDAPFASLNCSSASRDDPKKVLENRRRVAAYFGRGLDDLCLCQQVHSVDVVEVTDSWPETARPKADAMVTRQNGLILGLLTADCAPILFADPQTRVVGAAHAGWRGAVGGIVFQTLEAMEQLGARREAIVAAVGPCIWQDSYEVDGSFRQNLLDMNPDHMIYFKPSSKEGHFLFNLPLFVGNQLRYAGVGKVLASPQDTFANEDDFFSHRRGSLRGVAEEGRMISCIMLT
jgi:YfiH family protein